MPTSLRWIALVLFLLPWCPAPAFAQLVTRDAAPQSVRLASQSVDARLENGLATVHLHQVFQYDGARNVEAVYTFPLPDHAALTGFTLTAGGERMEGVLTERKQARRTYDRIVRSKKDPALLEKVGRGRFRLSVFPVVPGADTVIDLHYVQRVAMFEGAFQLTLPLGGDAAAGATTTVNVRVDSHRGLAEATASLELAQVIHQGEREALITYERGPGSTDRSPDGLVITARPASVRPSFDVETYRAESGETYFVAVYSPGTPREDQLLPRDIVLVLDTSGSMEGQKLERARSAAHWLVDELRDGDRVNLVRFSSDVSAAFPELQAASAETRAALHASIDALKAQGSTALGDALNFLGDMPEAEGRSRSVVLLTDGQPTIGEVDPARLIESAGQLREAGLRLHTFGVGNDVDAGLLQGMAVATGGTTEVFDNPLEIEPRLQRFLTRTTAPALRHLRLSADGVQLREIYPRATQDAYLGEEIVLTGRLDGDGEAVFHLDGESSGGPVRLTCAPSSQAREGDRSIVAMQFATRKLTELEGARRLRGQLSAPAYDAARKFWSEVDAGRYSTTEEIEQEMILTSLTHGVQCAYTSFLAVESAERARIGAQAGPDQEEGPILEEFEVSDQNETDTNEDYETNEDESAVDSPFDMSNSNAVLGIGGGGTKERFRPRLAANRFARMTDGLTVQTTLERELSAWPTETSALSLREEALSALAYLGNGQTMAMGAQRGEMARLVKSIRALQDRDTLRFVGGGKPDDATSDPVLDHLLATLAITEVYGLERSILLRTTAQNGLRHIEALLADPEGVSSWSDGALLVAIELDHTARAARLRFDVDGRLQAEARKRATARPLSLLTMAASVQTTPAGPEREALANQLVTALLDTQLAGDDVAVVESLLRDPARARQLWWIADALHAVGGASWTRFQLRRQALLPKLPPASTDSSREARAALVLVLEASFRLGPPAR